MSLSPTEAEEVAEGVERLVAVFHPAAAESETRSKIEVEVNTDDLSKVSEGLAVVGYTFAYVTRWLD